jgi:hypothetical protein
MALTKKSLLDRYSQLGKHNIETKLEQNMSQLDISQALAKEKISS